MCGLVGKLKQNVSCEVCSCVSTSVHDAACVAVLSTVKSMVA